jgi:hypothetical protein
MYASTRNKCGRHAHKQLSNSQYWPHLQLQDALLNGAGDGDARHLAAAAEAALETEQTRQQDDMIEDA